MDGSCLCMPFLRASQLAVAKFSRNAWTRHPMAMLKDVFTQESWWMDETTMLDWIEQVWLPCAEVIQGHKILLFDKCTSHITEEVCCDIANANAEIKVTPRGYASKSQPTDVGLNKPFKDCLRHELKDFSPLMTSVPNPLVQSFQIQLRRCGMPSFHHDC